MMAVFSFVLAGLLGALHLTNADEVILMEPFDPLKVTGTWRVWKRNTHLIEQTSTVRCIEVEIEHDENSGDIFKMLVKWIDPNNGNLNISFYVVDDRSHPARFFFKADQHRIALSVLGTDYNNWAVAYGMLGLKESYFVAARKLPLDDAALTDVESIISKNQVSKDFTVVDHSSC